MAPNSKGKPCNKPSYQIRKSFSKAFRFCGCFDISCNKGRQMCLQPTAMQKAICILSRRKSAGYNQFAALSGKEQKGAAAKPAL